MKLTPRRRLLTLALAGSAWPLVNRTMGCAALAADPRTPSASKDASATTTSMTASESPAAHLSPDYPGVAPGQPLAFPRDHGSHPDFRTEWWYLTAWLDTPHGAMGLQLTFFRSRTPHARNNPSRFAARQLYFAHAAIADPAAARLIHSEQAAREDPATAIAGQSSTDIVLGRPGRRWTLQLADGKERYVARVENPAFNFELDIDAKGQPALQGKNGFSRKGPLDPQASWYYSRPHLDLRGSLTVNGTTLPVTGTGWLDHEWSSELLDPDAAGWDWVGLNLHDGSALMAFRMRSKTDGDVWKTARRFHPPASPGGPWRPEDLDVRFEVLRRWPSPRTGAQYPVALRITVGAMTIVIEPLFDDQELDSRASTGIVYWEGAVRVMDGDQPTAIEIGRGYLELTGYATPVLL